MRYLAFALALVGAALTAQAQTATPDLRHLEGCGQIDHLRQ